MESNVKLYPHQEKALGQLKSGVILNGDVGSGKTFTSLFFYKKNYANRKLFVITTAKKRDSGDWEDEATLVGIENIIVDSWNNLERYVGESNAFFIFDEQRVVGYGAWTKNFLKITKVNHWILLSGTPGDTWMDYIPVFIANGFYRNKTHFTDIHVEYDRFSKFPKVKRFHGEGILLRHRNDISVVMKIDRHTTRHRKYVDCDYDKESYKLVVDKRWNIFEEAPIQNASEYTQVLRKLVSTSDPRIAKATWLMTVHDKIIVFYNYTYELEILKHICELNELNYSQWNGRKHDELPDTDQWVYLVQYTAGAEGWNCVTTNTILFYSLNYSYKIMEQSEGRIDRLNTPFIDLEYFVLTSTSDIDKRVRKAVATKKKFNDTNWMPKELKDYFRK